MQANSLRISDALAECDELYKIVKDRSKGVLSAADDHDFAYALRNSRWTLLLDHPC